MKKLILLLCCVFPLAGCVPAALVVGAAAGGALIYNKRSVGTMMADRHISQTAQNLVDNDPYLKGRSHISVATDRGMVLVVGQVQAPALRQRAMKLIDSLKTNKHTPGIQRIYDEITIQGSTSYLQRTSDVWLTSKVKTALLTVKQVPSRNIKVVTEDNVVYLMGSVNQQQGNAAANVARRISGVSKVVKVFQYS